MESNTSYHDHISAHLSIANTSKEKNNFIEPVIATLYTANFPPTTSQRFATKLAAQQLQAPNEEACN